jgi:hypothetical protein
VSVESEVCYMHGINNYCNDTVSCAVGRVQEALMLLGRNHFNSNSVTQTASSVSHATLCRIQYSVCVTSAAHSSK